MKKNLFKGLAAASVLMAGLSFHSAGASADVFTDTFGKLQPKLNVEQKLNVVIEYADALTHAKIKYKYGGTSEKGFDASGFVQHVYGKAGVKLPRTSAAMQQTGKTIQKKDLKPGDLVFFNTAGGSSKKASFVGIYAGHNQFFAVTVKKGVTVVKLTDSYWAKKYLGAKQVM